MSSTRCLYWSALGLLVALPALSQSHLFPPTATFEEIGPDRSTLDASDPDGASGGRVNGLAVVPGNNDVFYAASEWGGLFKSIDAGRTWKHLAGHVPQATWDVEVDAANVNRVYATSFYDGRTSALSAIAVSLDGGVTWNRPPTALPPAGFCATPDRREEPSAFGIAIDPDEPENIYVGTNCGLAISNNSGLTWRFTDPTPIDGADNVWDAVVHDGGTIDLCGDDGHLRSTDGGATWQTATSSPLPGGRCAIAASPEESYVLFAVVGTTIYESDDGGGSWPVTYANPSAQGRIPFVATNDRPGKRFDLWFGDVRLHRADCNTPSSPAPGGSARCPSSASWAGPFTRSSGAHDDSGDIAFDSEAATTACPVLFSSDGGVYFNTLTADPACHSPSWEQPDDTPQALWNFDMAGITRAGAAGEDLYFGNQDNGNFGTVEGGAPKPDWNNQRCCDGFDVAGEPDRVLSTVCCFSPPPATRLFLSNAGLTGGGFVNDLPPGTLRAFQQLDSIANFGPADYVVVTSSGVFITTDVTASPIVWTQLGAATTPTGACGVDVSKDGATTVFFVKSGGCNGDIGGTLWRFRGTDPAGTWQQITREGGGSFGIYDVDPDDDRRIIASELAGATPAMVLTTDRGATWLALAQLDSLMTGAGVFRYRTNRGPTSFTRFDGYPQPTLVAFDPADDRNIVSAGADSGVFLTTNGGLAWRLLTDPVNPGVSGKPHIPRARYAHFDHDLAADTLRIYLGTQGRGTWRITYTERPRITWTDCARYPWRCGLFEADRNLVRLECLVRDCTVFDPIPKNCLVKWNCPGCGPGGLCPPWYHILVERGNWEVDLIDLGGSPVDYVRSDRGNYVILSFRPTQDLFIDGQIGDYVLLFQMRDGKPGVPQDLRSTVRKSDRPLGEAEIDALVSEAEAEWRLPSASRQPHRE